MRHFYTLITTFLNDCQLRPVLSSQQRFPFVEAHSPSGAKGRGTGSTRRNLHHRVELTSPCREAQRALGSRTDVPFHCEFVHTLFPFHDGRIHDVPSDVWTNKNDPTSGRGLETSLSRPFRIGPVFKSRDKRMVDPRMKMSRSFLGCFISIQKCTVIFPFQMYLI